MGEGGEGGGKKAEETVRSTQWRQTKQAELPVLLLIPREGDNGGGNLALLLVPSLQKTVASGLGGLLAELSVGFCSQRFCNGRWGSLLVRALGS